MLSLREHVDAVRKNEREEAEKLWKHHLRYSIFFFFFKCNQLSIRDKLSTLRSELSEQYSTESKAALHKMAELKEAALNQAEEQWNQQKSQLTKQVSLKRLILLVMLHIIIVNQLERRDEEVAALF